MSSQLSKPGCWKSCGSLPPEEKARRSRTGRQAYNQTRPRRRTQQWEHSGPLSPDLRVGKHPNARMAQTQDSAFNHGALQSSCSLILSVAHLSSELRLRSGKEAGKGGAERTQELLKPDTWIASELLFLTAYIFFKPHKILLKKNN